MVYINYIINRYKEMMKEIKSMYDLGLLTTPQYHRQAMDIIKSCEDEIVNCNWSKSTAKEIVDKML